MLKVPARKRDTFGKGVQRLRKEGSLPAVLYGKKQESIPLVLDTPAFLRAWKTAGETTVISLDIEGGSSKEVMIHDVAKDPVKGLPIHVDFYAFDKNQTITVKVPLVFHGVPLAVKDLGGTLVKVLHDVEVEALPNNIPHEITVDISPLTDLDSHICVKDLTVSAGVKILADAEETVVSVSGPRAEEEEEEQPVDISEIEVEHRGKKEEEAEGDSAHGPSKEE